MSLKEFETIYLIVIVGSYYINKGVITGHVGKIRQQQLYRISIFSSLLSLFIIMISTRWRYINRQHTKKTTQILIGFRMVSSLVLSRES